MTVRKNSKVTALLPAYQAADFIQDTLDSLSSQTYDNFNVIVSVDVCTDKTYEICLKHSQKDHRFTVFRQDQQRLGYVGNCNFLIAKASADLVFLAFHDDLLESTYVEKLAEALDDNPSAVLAYSDLHYTAVDGSEKNIIYTELDNLQNRVDRGFKLLNRTGKWWVPNRGLFRLERAKKIQGLKVHESGEFSTDWPWLFHMSLLGEFVRVPEVLYHKFRKRGSLSRSWDSTIKEWYDVSASCVREIWISELTTDEKIRLSAPMINVLINNRSKV